MAGQAEPLPLSPSPPREGGPWPGDSRVARLRLPLVCGRGAGGEGSWYNCRASPRVSACGRCDRRCGRTEGHQRVARRSRSRRSRTMPAARSLDRRREKRAGQKRAPTPFRRRRNRTTRWSCPRRPRPRHAASAWSLARSISPPVPTGSGSFPRIPFFTSCIQELSSCIRWKGYVKWPSPGSLAENSPQEDRR